MTTISHHKRNALGISLAVIASLLVSTQTACDGGGTDATRGNTAKEATTGSASSTDVAQNAPAADAVKIEVAPVRLARGGSADAVVRVVIAPGFHVNANPATHSYLIPTALSIRGNTEAGVTASTPIYPEGVTHKFAFDATPLRVYEGTAEIKLELKATGEAIAGGRSIPLRVRAQPCDDAVCHPPRTLEATLPVIVE